MRALLQHLGDGWWLLGAAIFIGGVWLIFRRAPTRDEPWEDPALGRVRERLNKAIDEENDRLRR